jgi:alpha-galactosidase
VVEISALVDGGGIQPLQVGTLPPGILSTLRARIDQQELTVDAALHGDRRLALQALLAEPSIHSVANAEAMLDELLRIHADHLPAFT